jgi:two-component system NtrC family sensor kinase
VASLIAILGPKETQTSEISRTAEAIGAVLLESWNGERLDVAISTIDNIHRNIKTLALLPNAKIIVVGLKNPAAAIAVTRLLEEVTVFAWVESFASEEFQNRTLQALDEARESRQASESLLMYLEHNESLQRLSEELEARIEDRRNELGESTVRLQQSQRRSEIMHRALNAVHVSTSIPEMERQLLQIFCPQIFFPQNHASSDAPNVEWIRIAFNAQTNLETRTVDARATSVFSCQLGTNGHIYFGRAPERPFRSDDKSFLSPIAEAVSLAVTRLHSLERMEQIKREWEETFNAIVNPVAVLDDQLRLVRGNRALLRGRAPEQLVGRPCFEAIFSRTEPCSGCPVFSEFNSGKFRGRGWGIANARTMQFRTVPQQLSGQAVETFEVSSRPLTKTGHRDFGDVANSAEARSFSATPNMADSNDAPLLVHLYRDATTTARFEKRIVESSKMAELGTIGSSIAHQLNNPIGGMLSHIQLLLMDMKKLDFQGKDELFNELKEMENGTRRCAEIVRDLLGFTRRGDEDQAHDHDLAEIVEQAIKITELQTRSRGIRFKLDTGSLDTDSSEPETFLVHGRFNLLAQAVRAVLLALLPERLRDQQIVLEISVNQNEVEIRTSSVEADASSNENLDLTVAEQILTEHGGRLVLSKSDLVQQAILSLPRAKV